MPRFTRRTLFAASAGAAARAAQPRPDGPRKRNLLATAWTREKLAAVPEPYYYAFDYLHLERIVAKLKMALRDGTSVVSAKRERLGASREPAPRRAHGLSR